MGKIRITMEESAPPGEPIFHSQASLRARLAHTVGPLTLKPLLTYMPLVTPVFLALRSADFAVGLLPPTRKLTRTIVNSDHWLGHLFEPKASQSEKLVIYFHGGAFISCGLGTHRRLVESLVRATGAAALNVAYRQYPQVNFDASVQDCHDAVAWALAQGYLPEQLILAGDSAGGGLAVRVAGDLLKKGVSVGGVIGLSAWLDFDSTPKQRHRWARKDAYIPAVRLAAVTRKVLGREPTTEDSPLASFAEDYPPTLLIAGASELLRIDTEQGWRRLRELSVPCEVHYFRGGVHAFPVAVDFFPEAVAALELMVSFINRLSSENHDAYRPEKRFEA